MATPTITSISEKSSLYVTISTPPFRGNGIPQRWGTNRLPFVRHCALAISSKEMERLYQIRHNLSIPAAFLKPGRTVFCFVGVPVCRNAASYACVMVKVPSIGSLLSFAAISSAGLVILYAWTPATEEIRFPKSAFLTPFPTSSPEK